MVLLLAKIFSIIIVSISKLVLTAVISTNIAIPCPGETVIYTCVAQGNAQQWVVSMHTTRLEVTFLREDTPGTSEQHFGPGGSSYTWTLTSTRYQSFTSTLSFVATRTLDNLLVECVATTYAKVYVNIAGNLSYTGTTRLILKHKCMG